MLGHAKHWKPEHQRSNDSDSRREADNGNREKHRRNRYMDNRTGLSNLRNSAFSVTPRLTCVPLVYDFGRDLLSQMTTDGVSHWPVWSPDGTQLAYCSGPMG